MGETREGARVTVFMGKGGADVAGEVAETAGVFVSRFLPLLKRALCAPVQVGTGMFCCARVLCRALWGEFCSFGGAGSDGVLRGGDTDLQLQGVVPNLMEEIGHFWMQEGFYRSALQTP